MFRNLSFTIILLSIITSIMLFGCNSSEQTKANNEDNSPITLADNTIILDGRSYDLLELEGLTELSFKAYWPIDTELPEADIESFINNLSIVDSALKSHLSLSLPSIENTSLIFSPLVNASENETQFIQRTGEQAQVTFPIGSRFVDEYFSQKLLSLFYINERTKQINEISLQFIIMIMLR